MTIAEEINEIPNITYEQRLFTVKQFVKHICKTSSFGKVTITDYYFADGSKFTELHD